MKNELKVLGKKITLLNAALFICFILYLPAFVFVILPLCLIIGSDAAYLIEPVYSRLIDNEYKKKSTAPNKTYEEDTKNQ